MNWNRLKTNWNKPKMNWVPGNLRLIGKQNKYSPVKTSLTVPLRECYGGTAKYSFPHQDSDVLRQKPHSYTVQLVMLNVKLTRWTLCFSFFLPFASEAWQRRTILKKWPSSKKSFLEHVDICKIVLFEENRGRNRSLKSVAHCVYRQFGGERT